MSIIRKSVLATVVIGAGLGSLSGVASAHESAPAPSSGGCSNAVAAENSNEAGRSLGDVIGGGQAFDLGNTCDFLNGNSILNGSNVAAGASTIRNGDNEDRTSTETTTSDTTETTEIADEDETLD